MSTMKLSLPMFLARVRDAKNTYDIDLLGLRLREYGPDGLRAIAALLDDPNTEVIARATAVIGTAHVADNAIVRPALAKLLKHPTPKMQMMVLPGVICQALNGYEEAVNGLREYVTDGNDQMQNYLVALNNGDFSAKDRKSKYLPKL